MSKNSLREVKIVKKNIGSTERVLRVLAGLGIISLAFVGPSSPWAFLGIIPLATGLIGWCPPYALLGISTCKNGK
jgi:Inner membrane protein YgaP-like, transmembrane domain